VVEKVELIWSKGKSDNEVMRFVKASWLNYLNTANTDVPAGDIELEEEKLDTCLVNKRLRNEFTGVLTGRNFFEVH
jgi:glutamate dehydrogenase/leucine dehydrogenase